MKFRKDFVTNSSSTSFGASLMDVIAAILGGAVLTCGSDKDDEDPPPESEFSIDMAVSKDVLRTDGSDYIWVYGKVCCSDEKLDTTPYTEGISFSFSPLHANIISTEYVDGYKAVCIQVPPLKEITEEKTAEGKARAFAVCGKATVTGSISFTYDLYCEAPELIATTEPEGSRSLIPDSNNLVWVYGKVIINTPDGEQLDKEATAGIKFDKGANGEWLSLDNEQDCGDWRAVSVNAVNPYGSPNPDIVPPETAQVIITAQIGEKTVKQNINFTIEAEPKLEFDKQQINLLSKSGASDDVTFEIKNSGNREWNITIEADEYIRKFCEISEPEALKDDKYVIKVIENDTSEDDSSKKVKYMKGKVTVKTAWEDIELNDYFEVKILREGLFIDTQNGSEDDTITLKADGVERKPLMFYLYTWNEAEKTLTSNVEALKEIELSYKLTDDLLIQNAANVTQLDIAYKSEYMRDGVKYEAYTVNPFPCRQEYITIQLGAGKSIGDKRFDVDFAVRLKAPDNSPGSASWERELELISEVIEKIVPADHRPKFYEIINSKKNELSTEGLVELRRQIIIKAKELNESIAMGYLTEAAWYDFAMRVAEYFEIAGDVAMSALTVAFLGPLAGVGADIVRQHVISAIKAKAEGKSMEQWLDEEIKGIIPMITGMVAGFVTDPTTIEMAIGKSPKAQAVAYGVYFGYNFFSALYNGASLYEAAKQTAGVFAKRLAVQYLSGKLTTEWANIKIGELKTKIQNQGGLSKDDISDIMSDSRFVRSIKNSGDSALQEAFSNGLKQHVYKPHDTALTHWLKNNVPGLEDAEIKIDDFSTPGKSSKVNTDRDYRVLIKNGDDWVELPTKVWKDKSYEIFGSTTGFDSSTAYKSLGIDKETWDSMSPAEQRETWANKNYRQLATDKDHAEACKDFSDQYGDGEPNIVKVKRGDGKLIDPDDMGRMYEKKVIDELLANQNKTEAFAQLQKGYKQLIEVREGYAKQGLKMSGMDSEFTNNMKRFGSMETDLTAGNNPHFVKPDEILDMAAKLRTEISKLKNAN